VIRESRAGRIREDGRCKKAQKSVGTVMRQEMVIGRNIN
jgi:hypothetical protein